MADFDLNTGPDLPAKTDYRIGCIGAGFIIADIQIPAYRRRATTSSRSPRARPSTRARRPSGTASATVYDTWQELLDDPDVEIVDVAFPPDQQLEIVQEACKRAHIKGILAQKPLASTLAEAVEMVQVDDEAGKVLAVNHNMRYDQSMRALKTLLDRGDLGEPVVGAIVMHARPHWQAFLEGTTGSRWLNMSIHHLDAFRYLFGDPERIFVSARTDPRTSSRTATASAFYILEYANGFRGDRLDNCCTWVRRHYIKWRVEGTEGLAKGTIGWPDYPAAARRRSLGDARKDRPAVDVRAGRSAGSPTPSRARWARCSTRSTAARTC